MLVPKPVFHRLAQEAVETLAKDSITCTPDEILWLHEMAGKVLRPTTADELMLDMPVPCGNVVFWPLSVGARIWLEKYGKPWFAGTGDMEELVLAFAMANSRQPEVLHALHSCFIARLKVVAWAMKISATRTEINAAVARCLAAGDESDLVDVKGPEPKSTASQTVDYGDCIALLCHYYGESPAYWLWQESEEKCAVLLHKISTLLPENKSTDVTGAKFAALGKFKLVVAWIRASRKQSQSGGEA